MRLALPTHRVQISNNLNSELVYSLDASVHPHRLSEADNWAPAGPSFLKNYWLRCAGHSAQKWPVLRSAR